MAAPILEKVPTAISTGVPSYGPQSVAFTKPVFEDTHLQKRSGSSRGPYKQRSKPHPRAQARLERNQSLRQGPIPRLPAITDIEMLDKIRDKGTDHTREMSNVDRQSLRDFHNKKLLKWLHRGWTADSNDPVEIGKIVTHYEAKINDPDVIIPKKSTAIRNKEWWEGRIGLPPTPPPTAAVPQSPAPRSDPSTPGGQYNIATPSDVWNPNNYGAASNWQGGGHY